MTKCELCNNCNNNLVKCVNCETEFCSECGDAKRCLCEDCVAYNEVNDNIDLDEF